MGRREIFHRNGEGNSQKIGQISFFDYLFNLTNQPRGTSYGKSPDYRRWGGYSQLL